MAGHNYSGTAPVESVHALDDGGQIRIFFSDQSLAAALLNGYGEDASQLYGQRPASLQTFDDGGRWDLTAFIGISRPDRSPSLNSPEHRAFENGGRYDGPRDPWDALQKRARKQEAADRKLLAQRIAIYRAALRDAAPLPNADPFTDRKAPP